MLGSWPLELLRVEIWSRWVSCVRVEDLIGRNWGTEAMILSLLSDIGNIRWLRFLVIHCATCLLGLFHSLVSIFDDFYHRVCLLSLVYNLLTMELGALRVSRWLQAARIAFLQRIELVAGSEVVLNTVWVLTWAWGNRLLGWDYALGALNWIVLMWLLVVERRTGWYFTEAIIDWHLMLSNMLLDRWVGC